MNQHAPDFRRPTDVVVGVDFGTQSGRALVVRVSDGEELGSAVHPYPHGVLDRALPDGTPLGPDWALQVAVRLPRGPPGRHPASPAGRRRRPRSRDRHRDRLHGLHDGADHRGRHPALGGARARRRTPRVRQAVASPRSPGPGRPAQRAGPQALRGVARPIRRTHLVGVGVREGPPAARGGARGLRPHGALRRGRRLDRLAALRHADPQRLQRRLQGDPPGRHLPEPRLPRRAPPGLRRLRQRQDRPSSRGPRAIASAR